MKLRDREKGQALLPFFSSFSLLFSALLHLLIYTFLSLRYFLLFLTSGFFRDLPLWSLLFLISSETSFSFSISLPPSSSSSSFLSSIFLSLLRSSSVSSPFEQDRFSRISIFIWSRVCLAHVRTPCPGLYRKPRLGLLAARSSARRSRKRARVIQGRSSTTAGLNDSWGASTGPPLFVFLPSSDSSRCFLLYGND